MSSRFFIILLFLLLCEIIINQNCNNSRADNRNDCFTYSNSDGYCCYDASNNKCFQVKKEDLGKKNYDCGITEDNFGKYEFQQYQVKQEDIPLGFQTCGKKSPEKFEDCSKYSEITNSCCYFHDEQAAKKVCFSIGKKGDTKGKEEYFEINNTKFYFQCSSSNIMFNIF